MHRAGFFVDPSVAVEFVVFVDDDSVELTALVFLQFGVRESALRLSGSDVARVGGNICYQRVHRRLRRLFAVVEIYEDPSENAHTDRCADKDRQQEIENARRLQILVLVSAVSGWGLVFGFVGHF